MAKKQEKISVSTWVSLGIACAAIIGVFIPWLKISVSFLGASISSTVGIFETDGSIFLLSKILVILAIIVAILTIVNLFVDLKSYVKPLEKIDVSKLAPIVTYGLFAGALLFALIGALTTDTKGLGSVGISFGYIIELIIVAAGLTLAIKPSLLNKIIKTK